MPLYHRLAHMLETPLVKKGDWVKRGQVIGKVGSTGKSSGPHCHYDILVSHLPATVMNFTQYVYGLAMHQVRAKYADPKPYIKDAIPMDRSLPSIGYHYLQYVANGNYYHSGEDCNGVNDLGKPIKSPVEGRVVFVLGTSWIKNIFGKIIGKNYNSGWGNMVVIEESPNFKL